MKEEIFPNQAQMVIEALLNPPKTYQNLSLIPTLKTPIYGVLRIRPITYDKSPKALKIRAAMLDFDEILEMVIFHPKPFHRALFPVDEVIYVYGVVQKRFGYEMIQPKVVKEFGKILPIFSKHKAKNTKILNQVHHLITRENLERLGFPQEMIDALWEVFYPTLDFVTFFEKNKAFPPASLEALKMLEVYWHLQKLKRKKIEFPAKFQCDGDHQPFVDSLPFALTQGQKQAIEQIALDLRQNIAARRVVMGDVGCGKTIVILASVMMAYPYKSILMVPTTILAHQIYSEAQKFLPDFVRIGLFVGDSKRQNFEEFDFVIGTQALLYQNEDLSDFALVMSDEQHRFGTMQRHTLEKLASKSGKKPHILQFSATPIPRTMAMLQSELIAHTLIQDTPFSKDISTQIIRNEDFTSLLRHIQAEIAQDHQIAIVYPLVEESERLDYMSLSQAQGFWMKHFEGVYSTNGGDKNKDEVLAEFRDRGSILLATTVIEVGISLPRLSTIVIVGAERMGFATLHQLRGRVSRNGLRGYCFLFTHQKQSQRLQEFAQTKSGFEIAELDLRYRKSGDLLEGKNQSGDEFVFFDPVCDLYVLQKAKELQIRISI
ncbi:ATP-dependent DNA helicase RecG [Helicobacter pametensis]|uniref:ATP-dependent DNA helicase RecG n=1 Tax=Helicobacter pametensis TaxID=95149 RepID=UPI0004803640|nr:ATP-dependent DNA helicase RecG [Helicobacter pametensis]